MGLVVPGQGIGTSTAVGRMLFHIPGSIAESGHALMSERTRDGLAAARARGPHRRAETQVRPLQVALARQMHGETGPDGERRYTVARIAAEFGIIRPVIYRHLSKGTT